MYLAHHGRTEIEGHHESDTWPFLVKPGTVLGLTSTFGIFSRKKNSIDHLRSFKITPLVIGRDNFG